MSWPSLFDSKTMGRKKKKNSPLAVEPKPIPKYICSESNFGTKYLFKEIHYEYYNLLRDPFSWMNRECDGFRMVRNKLYGR